MLRSVGRAAGPVVPAPAAGPAGPVQAEQADAPGLEVDVVLVPVEGLASLASIVPGHNRNPAHICPISTSHTLRNYLDPWCMQPLHVLLSWWLETRLLPITSNRKPLRWYALLSLNALLVRKKIHVERCSRSHSSRVPAGQVGKFVRGVTEAERCRGPNRAREQIGF